MRLRHLFTLLAAVYALGAHGYGISNDAVAVDVIDEYGRSYPMYKTRANAPFERRAYLEAVPGAPYAIRVTNRGAARVGLVIAVDGRNIISGRKSRLRHKEKMYVLEPWQSAVYEGWRTGRNRVNEFFFTSELDSYAGAFGDYSAMGVVAVAVFEDRYVPRPQPYAYRDAPRRKSEQPSARKRGDAAAESAAPGTGFGQERYSPSYRVDFRPQRTAASRTFIKYEWRETLCEMRVSRCSWRGNRFWPEASYRQRGRGFAAYPPGYRQRSRDHVVHSRRYR